MLWGDQEIRGDSEATRLRIWLTVKRSPLHDLLVRRFHSTVAQLTGALVFGINFREGPPTVDINTTSWEKMACKFGMDK